MPLLHPLPGSRTGGQTADHEHPCQHCYRVRQQALHSGPTNNSRRFIAPAAALLTPRTQHHHLPSLVQVVPAAHCALHLAGHPATALFMYSNNTQWGHAPSIQHWIGRHQNHQGKEVLFKPCKLIWRRRLLATAMMHRNQLLPAQPGTTHHGPIMGPNILGLQ